MKNSLSDGTVDGVKTCPISSIDYKGICPVVDCAYHSGQDGCIHTDLSAIKGTNLDSRVKLLNRARASVDVGSQVTQLKRLAKEFATAKSILRQRTACRNCGYPVACKSKSLCNERKEAVQYNKPIDLQPHEVWLAIINGFTSFLSKEYVESLRNLLDVSHVRKNKENTYG